MNRPVTPIARAPAPPSVQPAPAHSAPAQSNPRIEPVPIVPAAADSKQEGLFVNQTAIPLELMKPRESEPATVTPVSPKTSTMPPPALRTQPKSPLARSSISEPETAAIQRTQSVPAAMSSLSRSVHPTIAYFTVTPPSPPPIAKQKSEPADIHVCT